MSITTWSVNGIDLRKTFGFTPRSQDRLFAPDRTIQSLAIPGSAGFFLGGLPVWQSRGFSAEGRISPTGRTTALREAAEQDLTDLLYQGLVTVRVVTNSGLTREIQGLTTEFRPRPDLDHTRAIGSSYSWRVIAPEGSWRTPGLQQFAITGQSTGFPRCALPVGTAPSEFTLRIFGPTGSPTKVTFRRFTGDVISTLTITNNITNTETLTINGGDRTIWSTNGTGSPTAVAFTGDYPPAGISPEDASRVTSQYGTVEIQSVTTCLGEIAYPLRWLTT